MGWQWKEEHLDLILVPLGFLILCIYHLFLLYGYHKCRELTTIGYENKNKEAWIEEVFQVVKKDRSFAVSVLNGHVSASSSLSSISLVLCSLMGALLGNSSNFLTDSFILGDTSRSTRTIKYMAILSCFLLAFICFVQTSRHFVHGSFLICMTVDINNEHDHYRVCLHNAVRRGSIFWALGMRALYFATTLLLWIFGPIPMFVGSVATVVLLYFLDFRREKKENGQNTIGNGNGNGNGLC